MFGPRGSRETESPFVKWLTSFKKVFQLLKVNRNATRRYPWSSDSLWNISELAFFVTSLPNLTHIHQGWWNFPSRCFKSLFPGHHLLYCHLVPSLYLHCMGFRMQQGLLSNFFRFLLARSIYNYGNLHTLKYDLHHIALLLKTFTGPLIPTVPILNSPNCVLTVCCNFVPSLKPNLLLLSLRSHQYIFRFG